MSAIKKLLETTKRETVILGPLQRMLMGQGDYDGDRRHDVIHPSELVKPDFCDLALYYRLSGWEIPKEQYGFQLEVIFEQGHGYHAKWQNWIWDLGMLRGRYRCLSCLHGDWKTGMDEWTAISPVACPACGASRQHLEYGEVPISIPDHRIRGHSDGDIVLGGPIGDDPLLEIKSVGEGTIRFEAPKLIQKHTKTVTVDGDSKKWTDWNALWRDIRRPFKTHLKQGAIYCLAKGRHSMIYIYEFKPTGAVKEFRVKHDFAIIEEELETALDVLYHVKKKKPPPCPHGGCGYCGAYEKLRDGDGAQDEEEAESEGREDPGEGAGEGEAPSRGSRSSSRARRERLRGAGGTRRPLRRGSDGGAAREDRVGELPERAARRGRDHRGGSGDDPREDEGPRAARSRTRRSEGDQRDGAEVPRIVVRRRPRS